MGNAAQISGNLVIGDLRLAGRALLAPMSGVTDVAMRRIAMRFGATAVVSEMVACDDYVRGHEQSRLRAEGEGVAPHIVQLAGSDPHWMAEAARLAEASGAAAIDINMGCPAKRVTGGYAGSALMRDLPLATALIEATVTAVRVPVTLKMRLGWDDATRNAAELARRAMQAGVRLVTVHGRTRQQFYKGAADWNAIADVRAATTLPLVANGDCATLGDARAMLGACGADAVMIGRAAVGRPWLIGEIAAGLDGRVARVVSPGERADVAQEHLEGLVSAMGAQTGLRHARKHLAAYATHAGAPEGLRLALVTTDSVAQARRLLARCFDGVAYESLDHAA